MLGTLTLAALLVAGPLTDGLVFYASFDAGPEPSYAHGRAVGTAVATEFPAAKSRRGLRLGEGMQGYQFPCAGNMPKDAGTVAFWVKPEWTPLDRGEDRPGGRSLFRVARFGLNWQKKPNVLFFMTGDVVTPEAGYQWDYAVAARLTWPLGEWHHLAITWDKATGDKVLYLDGTPAATGRTDRITGGTWGGRDEGELGSAEAPGDYDELVIWNRVLSAEEVRRLVNDPTGVASELATKEAPPAPPPWPVKVGLAVLKETEAIVAPGEPKTLDVPLRNPGDLPVEAGFELRLVDLFGQVLARQAEQVTLQAKEERRLPVTFSTTRLGVFKVALTLNGTFHRDVGGFAVWPDPPPATPADSFFGSHIEQGRDYVAEAQRLGQNWARGHDMLQSSWWARVQPEPGAFDWGVEATLRRYQAHGIHVLAGLFAAPYWAARDGAARPTSKWAYPKGSVPRMDAWREYVKAVVGRYGDWVKHWEIWNEPEVSMFWHGTPEEYAELCRVAYHAAKEVDPTATLLVGGFTQVDYGFHEAAAKAGALRNCDGISFHAYSSPGSDPEELLKVVDHFRGLAKQYGRIPDLPLWDTEAGVRDTSFYDGLDFPELPPLHLRPAPNYRRGAARMVQAAVVLQSAGVVRHFYYLQKPPGPADSYLGTQNLEFTNVPRPKLMARRALAREVDGATYLAGRRGERGLRIHAYRKGTGSVAVAWCGDGETAAVTLPGGVEMIDLMGNPQPSSARLELTELPVFLRAPGLTAEALLAALR